VPEYIRTLDSTGIEEIIFHLVPHMRRRRRRRRRREINIPYLMWRMRPMY
jgi:hypothetical protein